MDFHTRSSSTPISLQWPIGVGHLHQVNWSFCVVLSPGPHANTVPRATANTPTPQTNPINQHKTPTHPPPSPHPTTPHIPPNPPPQPPPPPTPPPPPPPNVSIMGRDGKLLLSGERFPLSWWSALVTTTTNPRAGMDGISTGPTKGLKTGDDMSPTPASADRGGGRKRQASA